MTTTTKENPNNKLIHVARTFTEQGYRYLFLRKLAHAFAWFQEVDENNERQTEIEAPTIEEALRLAVKKWKLDSFRYVICGFRYTLPERDEHGINALFHQMVASYSSSNGIYYDEELGNNCTVQNASQEAYHLWQRLRQQQRL